MITALVLSIALGQAAAPVTPEAFPTDAPKTLHVKSGQVVNDDGFAFTLPEGLFLNTLATVKIERTLNQMHVQNIALTAENDALTQKVDEITADPPLSLKNVLIIAGISLVTGAGIGLGVGITVAPKH